MSNRACKCHRSPRLMDSLIGGTTAFAAALLAETLLGWLGAPALAMGHRFLVALIAGACGAALAAWPSMGRRRRLSRLVAISDAWLRGDLSLRTGDNARDGHERPCPTSGLLIETLAEDEQDLDRLRESNAGLTDQVRALTWSRSATRLALGSFTTR